MNKQGDVKVLALKCLQKMLQQFPKRFESFAELTILKVLELHKDDTYRDVSIREADTVLEYHLCHAALVFLFMYIHMLD